MVHSKMVERVNLVMCILPHLKNTFKRMVLSWVPPSPRSMGKGARFSGLRRKHKHGALGGEGISPSAYRGRRAWTRMFLKNPPSFPTMQGAPFSTRDHVSGMYVPSRHTGCLSGKEEVPTHLGPGAQAASSHARLLGKCRLLGRQSCGRREAK